jgi:ABC-type phosphate transport system permease subunit
MNSSPMHTYGTADQRIIPQTSYYKTKIVLVIIILQMQVCGAILRQC